MGCPFVKIGVKVDTGFTMHTAMTLYVTPHGNHIFISSRLATILNEHFIKHICLPQGVISAASENFFTVSVKIVSVLFHK